MIERMVAVAATTGRFVLAEGPTWDERREQLLWVDIAEGKVFAGALHEDGSIVVQEQESLPGTVGAVALAEDGGWLIASGHELYTRAPGRRPVLWQRILATGAPRRWNDGKPDPAGRLVVGTKREHGEHGRELLVSVEPNGGHRVLLDDLSLSNGLAWTRDGRRMFHVDTLSQCVLLYEYDPSTGDIGAHEVFVAVEHGYPDGICLDAEDHLWVAVWGAGEVRRYSPRGDLVAVISLPAPHASSVTFAGADLRTLVITTASDELTAAQLDEHPDSGRLFTVRTGIAGVAQPRWRGSTDAEEAPA